MSPIEAGQDPACVTLWLAETDFLMESNGRAGAYLTFASAATASATAISQHDIGTQSGAEHGLAFCQGKDFSVGRVDQSHGQRWRQVVEKSLRGVTRDVRRF